MGLFGNANKTKAGKRGTTIIAEGSRIEGELTLSAHLHIDGEVQGIIRSEADVAIGHSGLFHGDISARGIVVNGELSGNVNCEKLEIVAGGRVFADVVLEEIIVESGGLFEGQSQRKDRDSFAMLSHNGRKQPVLPASGETTDGRIDKPETGTTT